MVAAWPSHGFPILGGSSLLGASLKALVLSLGPADGDLVVRPHGSAGCHGGRRPARRGRCAHDAGHAGAHGKGHFGRGVCMGVWDWERQGGTGPAGAARSREEGCRFDQPKAERCCKKAVARNLNACAMRMGVEGAVAA